MTGAVAERLQRRLARGQALAEAIMLDQFTAFASTWDKVDGLDQKSWAEQDITFGKAAGRSAGADTNARVVTIGGVDRFVVEGGLQLPFDAVLPEIGWEYVCTWLGPTAHPSLLGRRWRVVDVPLKSHVTALRLDVVEV